MPTSNTTSVGRLGRNSKRWHSPGETLSIVVQDSDLGVSRVMGLARGDGAGAHCNSSDRAEDEQDPPTTDDVPDVV